MADTISTVAREAIEVGRGVMRVALPFLGNVLMYELRFKLSTSAIGHNGVPTACVTNSGWVLMHPAFAERVAASPQRAKIMGYIFAHEVLHIALRHAARARSLANTHVQLQPAIWNIACDLVIEQILRDVKTLVEPDSHTGMRGVRIEDFGLPPGLSAEEYYTRLLAIADELPSTPGCGSGAGNPLPSEDPAAGNQDPDTADDAAWTDAKCEQVAKQFAADLKACAEGSQRGTVPAGLLIEVGAAQKPSVIPWRSLMRTVVLRAIQRVPGDDYSVYTRRASRAAGLGVGYNAPFIAAKYEDRPRIAVVLDTSGSMNGVLGLALAEVDKILSTLEANVTFICCDTTASEPHEVSTVQEAEKLICGGGGTHLVPGIDKAKTSEPDIIVVLTDGYIGAVGENPGCGVIWGVIGRPPYTADVATAEREGWGVIVGIDE